MQSRSDPKPEVAQPRRPIGLLHNSTRFMKNILVFSSLILTAGCSAVGALSVLPVSSLFEFVAIYVAVGMLAFAFRDYGRRPRFAACGKGALTAQSAPIPFPQAEQACDCPGTALKAA